VRSYLLSTKRISASQLGGNATDLLDDGFLLLTFFDNQHDIIEFLETFKIYEDDLDFIRNVPKDRNITLISASERVKDIKKRIGPMMGHLDYFKVLVDAKPLLDFLSSRMSDFADTTVRLPKYWIRMIMF